MRLNKYLAQNAGLSRRGADIAIAQGRVSVNGKIALIGQILMDKDIILLDGNAIHTQKPLTLILNKPVGYICSRRQQGNSPTIYKLLPLKYYHLKPAGRLDKDSSGLLILTSDGALANTLTHPSRSKWKEYRVKTNHPLSTEHLRQLNEGIMLEDGISKLQISKSGNYYRVRMQEGRNRQIRRTFTTLGYTVTYLHRTSIGKIALDGLKNGIYREITGSIT